MQSQLLSSFGKTDAAVKPSSGILLKRLDTPADSWPTNPSQILSSYSPDNIPVLDGKASCVRNCFTLTTGTIGTAKNAAVRLGDLPIGIGPIHAEITQGLTGTLLHDKGTTGGSFIFVNARTARAFHPVKNGSRFWINKSLYQVGSIVLKNSSNAGTDTDRFLPIVDDKGTKNLKDASKKQVRFFDTACGEYARNTSSLKNVFEQEEAEEQKTCKDRLSSYCRVWEKQNIEAEVEVRGLLDNSVFKLLVKTDGSRRGVCVNTGNSTSWKDWECNPNTMTSNGTINSEILCYFDVWDGQVFIVDGADPEHDELAQCEPMIRGLFIQVLQEQSHRIMPCEVFFLGSVPFTIAPYSHMGYINKGCLLVGKRLIHNRDYFPPFTSPDSEELIGIEIDCRVKSLKASIALGDGISQGNHELQPKTFLLEEGITYIGYEPNKESSCITVPDFRLGKQLGFVQVEQSFAKVCNTSRGNYIRFMIGRSDLPCVARELGNEDVIAIGSCRFQVSIKLGVRRNTIQEVEVSRACEAETSAAPNATIGRQRRLSVITREGHQVASTFPLEQPAVRLREGESSVSFETLTEKSKERLHRLHEESKELMQGEQDFEQFGVQLELERAQVKEKEEANGNYTSSLLGENESVVVSSNYPNEEDFASSDVLVPEFSKNKLDAARLRLTVSHEFMKVRDTGSPGAITENFLELQCIKGPARSRRVQFFTNRITIGSRDDNNISLNDYGVSTHHAVIYKVNSKYYIQDRQSRTGTAIVLDTFRDTATLKAGDVFQSSDTEFQFLCSHNMPSKHNPSVASTSRFACVLS